MTDRNDGFGGWPAVILRLAKNQEPTRLPAEHLCRDSIDGYGRQDSKRDSSFREHVGSREFCQKVFIELIFLKRLIDAAPGFSADLRRDRLVELSRHLINSF